MPRISEFTPKYAPSPSASVAGVDVNENGEKINVQIPFSSFGEYKSYYYNAEYEGVNMLMLIKDLEAQGYNCDGTKQPMILTLSGAFGSRIFMGYITSYADGNSCQFELFDLANCIKYSQLETTSSYVVISTALNNAHPAKYTSGGIKYVTVSDADYTNISFANIALEIETAGGSMLGVNFVKIVEGGIDGNYLLNCDVYNGNTVSAYMLDLETLTQYSTNGATGLTNTLKDLIINRTYGSVTEVGGSSGDVVRQIKVSIPSMESCLTEITDAVNAEGLLDTTILIVLSGCFSGSYLANVQWCGGNRYIISMFDTRDSSTHSGNVDASTTTVREFLSTNENDSANDYIAFNVDDGGVTSYMIDLKAAIEGVRGRTDIPIFAKLQGQDSRTVLIWFKMNGDDTAHVYCWDLELKKYYYAAGLPLSQVRINDFFSIYEVKQESGGSDPKLTYTFDGFDYDNTTMKDVYDALIADGYPEGTLILLDICSDGYSQYRCFFDISSFAGGSLYRCNVFFPLSVEYAQATQSPDARFSSVFDNPINLGSISGTVSYLEERVTSLEASSGGGSAIYKVIWAGPFGNLQAIIDGIEQAGGETYKPNIVRLTGYDNALISIRIDDMGDGTYLFTGVNLMTLERFELTTTSDTAISELLSSVITAG